MNQQIRDVKHINTIIDSGDPDVKAYIENIEDEVTWLSENLLLVIEGLDGWEEIESYLKDNLEYYKERDSRTRK
ncbi:hypothetical protein ACLB83_002563 [Escherichia coli]